MTTASPTLFISYTGIGAILFFSALRVIFSISGDYSKSMVISAIIGSMCWIFFSIPALYKSYCILKQYKKDIV